MIRSESTYMTLRGEGEADKVAKAPVKFRLCLSVPGERNGLMRENNSLVHNAFHVLQTSFGYLLVGCGYSLGLAGGAL